MFNAVDQIITLNETGPPPRRSALLRLSQFLAHSAQTTEPFTFR